MQKIIAAFVAAFLLCVAPLCALAEDVTEHPTGLNPPSTWMNIAQRFNRVGEGTFWWGALCNSSSACTGVYQNLGVTPVSGLTVAVAPVVSASNGALYQYQVDDALPYGGYPSGVGIYLPADATQIMTQGLVPAGTNVGPLTVVAGSSSGQSVSNLIECKNLRSNINSVTVNLVSSSGSISPTSVPRDRVDRLTCQVASSASSASPTQPNVATGYTAIGYVTVPYGSGSVTTGMIAASTASAMPSVSNSVQLSPATVQTGNINVTGSISGGAFFGATGGFSGTVSAAALSGTSYIVDQAGILYMNPGNTASINYSGSAFSLTGGGLGIGSTTINSTTATFGGTSTFTGLISASGGLTTSGTVYTNSIIQNNSAASSFGNNGNYVLVTGSNSILGVQIDNANSSGTYISEFSLNNVAKSYILANGTLQSASDRRFKRNINYAPKYGIETIDALKPVSFDWRDTGKSDIGFIAQDVKSVVPSAVSSNGHRYFMNYSAIVPILVRAMQQQQTEIKHLEAQVKRLQK